jgi:hypothetical protein
MAAFIVLRVHCTARTFHRDRTTFAKFARDHRTVRMMIRVGEISKELKVGRSPHIAQEVHRLRVFVQMGCEAEFARIFTTRGWPGMETPDMIHTWRGTLPLVVGRDAPVVENLFYVERAFRDIFLALKRQGVATDTAAAGRVEAYQLLHKAKEEAATSIQRLQSELDTQTASIEKVAEERAQLAERRIKELEDQLVERCTEADRAKQQLMEAARMVKAAREREILGEHQLRVHTEEVRRLRELRSSTSTPTSSLHLGTSSFPPSQ